MAGFDRESVASSTFHDNTVVPCHGYIADAAVVSPRRVSPLVEEIERSRLETRGYGKSAFSVGHVEGPEFEGTYVYMLPCMKLNSKALCYE